MAATGTLLRTPVVSRSLLVLAVLVGAFATTSAITGWVYLRNGPIVSELGRVNGGEGSHSLLMEAAGVSVDVAVPLVDWWGEAEIYARSVSPGEIFYGEALVDEARSFLIGSSYAAVRPTGDATWKIFPVPGQGAPPDPVTREWSASGIGRVVQIPVSGSDEAMVIVRLDGDSPVIVDLSVQFTASHARTFVLFFVVLASGCFVGALFLVIRDPKRPRRKRS
jgi:hypothetical protein